MADQGREWLRARRLMGLPPATKLASTSPRSRAAYLGFCRGLRASVDGSIVRTCCSAPELCRGKEHDLAMYLAVVDPEFGFLDQIVDRLDTRSSELKDDEDADLAPFEEMRELVSEVRQVGKDLREVFVAADEADTVGISFETHSFVFSDSWDFWTQPFTPGWQIVLQDSLDGDACGTIWEETDGSVLAPASILAFVRSDAVARNVVRLLLESSAEGSPRFDLEDDGMTVDTMASSPGEALLLKLAVYEENDPLTKRLLDQSTEALDALAAATSDVRDIPELFDGMIESLQQLGWRGTLVDALREFSPAGCAIDFEVAADRASEFLKRWRVETEEQRKEERCQLNRILEKLLRDARLEPSNEAAKMLAESFEVLCWARQVIGDDQACVEFENQRIRRRLFDSTEPRPAAFVITTRSPIGQTRRVYPTPVFDEAHSRSKRKTASRRD